MPKVAVVVIGLGMYGVVAIFLDAIVIGKEILNIVTILEMLLRGALKLMNKRVHDLSPYLK